MKRILLFIHFFHFTHYLLVLRGALMLHFGRQAVILDGFKKSTFEEEKN